MTHVYLVTDSTAYKIGVATNVDFRVGELQIGNPRRLTLVCASKCPSPFDVERLLHDRYQHKWISGEWFDLDAIEAGEVVEYLNSHEPVEVKPPRPIAAYDKEDESVGWRYLSCGRNRQGFKRYRLARRSGRRREWLGPVIVPEKLAAEVEFIEIAPNQYRAVIAGELI